MPGRCPVHRVDTHEPPYYVLTRFGDVAAALKDPERWRNGDGPGVFYQEAGVLGTTDDPDHARHRRILRGAFLPSAMARLEPRLAAIADSLLDDLVPRREGDFVEAFAAPFPALAIGELLGVRPEDRRAFRAWSDDIVAALAGGDLGAYRTATAALGDYVDGVLAEREGIAVPDLPDDVFTTMLLARRDGALSAGEVRHLGHQLLVAGHETTTSLLGLLLHRLVTHPPLMAALRADRDLVPVAVEEAVRVDSPVQGLFRTSADSERVAGVDIEPRAKVQLLFAAANRDPDRWDDPDEFRLDRAPLDLRGHLGFGWGIHFCLGAPLARLEARIAFDRILDRMLDIELAGEPRRSESFVLHGLTSLPLRWRPADETPAERSR
jgi:cytochrome P450